MIAAIYARKFTDQSAVVDEAKSVTRQVDHARTFAAERGWTVDGPADLRGRRHQRPRVREPLRPGMTSGRISRSGFALRAI